DRTVFLVTSKDDALAKAAAKQVGAALQKSGAFASLTAELPPFDMSQIGGLSMPYRFGLLTRDDHDAAANNTASLHDALMPRIYNPVRGPLATHLADAPFGWLAQFLSALPLATSNLD
ncbi:MMPL family transporter, partial [Paraburkholderia sp. SIMBA_054]